MIELASKAKTIHQPDFSDTTPKGVLTSAEKLVADFNTQVARLHALGLIVKLKLVDQPKIIGSVDRPPKLHFDAFMTVTGKDL